MQMQSTTAAYVPHLPSGRTGLDSESRYSCLPTDSKLLIGFPPFLNWGDLRNSFLLDTPALFLLGYAC